MRHRLTRIVLQLAQAPRPGELRQLLAAALGDPTLELLHATDVGWIDSTGASRSLPEADGRAVTSLVQDGARVAVVIHRPELLDEPRLVEELASAASLVLEHDRLQAHLRAQLDRLRQSRVTAVMAADSERRQLERDLHDGAQQALAALAIAVEIERVAAVGAPSAALGRAQEQIRNALEEVRTIAHGLYPAVLEAAGLDAPELGELEDRIGVIDGRLHVSVGSEGERVLRAELPCV